MKLREARELKNKSTDELSELLGSLHKSYFQARIKHGVGQLEKTSDLRTLRRDIARVQTALRSKSV